MTDPWQDPEIKQWVKHIKDELEPMIKDSAVCVSICPSRKNGVDTKFAVELGYMIMLDKPILVVAETNDEIPSKLRLVADEIVIGQVGEPGFSDRVMAAMERLGRS